MADPKTDEASLIMDDDAFFAKLREYVENEDQASLLQLIDTKGAQVAQLVRETGRSRKHTVLTTVIYVLLFEEPWTINHTIPMEIVRAVAQRCTQYDPEHIARCMWDDDDDDDMYYPTNSIHILQDLAAEILRLNAYHPDFFRYSFCNTYNAEEAATIAAEPVILAIIHLYELVRPQWKECFASQADYALVSGWKFHHPLHVIALLALHVCKPSKNFQDTLCRFFQDVGTLFPEALVAGQQTVLHFICSYLRECSSSNYSFWSQLTLTVLQCNPEAATTKYEAPSQTLPSYDLLPCPHHIYGRGHIHKVSAGILPFHDLMVSYKNEQVTEAAKAVFSACPQAFLIPNPLGPVIQHSNYEDFDSRGDKTLFLPQWLIEGYVSAYDENRELPDESDAKVFADGNALHDDLLDKSSRWELFRVFCKALRPNHPMLTEWDSKGKTPLHLLLEANGCEFKTPAFVGEIIQQTVQRHPDTIQRRTKKTRQHPIQVLLSKCCKKWDKLRLR